MIDRIEDKHILDIITALGAPTAPQIIAQVNELYPDQDRGPAGISKMIYSLVRYRFIDYTDIRRGSALERHYYIAGTQHQINPYIPCRVRIAEFLTARAPQEYTSKEIAQAIGTTPDSVTRYIKAVDGAKRTAGPIPRYYVEVGQC